MKTGFGIIFSEARWGNIESFTYSLLLLTF